MLESTIPIYSSSLYLVGWNLFQIVMCMHVISSLMYYSCFFTTNRSGYSHSCMPHATSPSPSPLPIHVSLFEVFLHLFCVVFNHLDISLLTSGFPSLSLNPTLI